MGRTASVSFLCGFLLFASIASAILMNHISMQALKPMQALDTELILQKPSAGGKTSGFETGGLITPFGMEVFDFNAARSSAESTGLVKASSSALILWKLDTGGTLVTAGIKKDDPDVGLRKIGSMIFHGEFFSSDDASEVMLERHYAAFFGYKTGSVYRLSGYDLKVTGIVDFSDQSNLNAASVFLPYETAVKMSGLENNQVNQMYVSLNSAYDTELFTQKTGELPLLADFQMITKDSLYKNLRGISGIMLGFGKTVTLVLFGGGVLLCIFLLRIHAYDFRKNSETLRMLGWSAALRKKWTAADTLVILATAALFCAILTILFLYAGLPAVNIAAPSVQELVL
jgi:hypothetical protein